MSEQVSPWLTILGLVPFLIVLGIFFAYLLINRWRQETIAYLTGLRSDLRQIQNSLRELQRDAQAFSIEDPEPFGSVVAEAIEAFRRVETNLAELYSEYAHHHSRINHLSRPKLVDWLRQPFDWYRLREETISLNKQISLIETQLEETDRLVNRLRRMGWEMASRSREILALAQQAAGMFQELSHDAQLVDPVVDSAWQDACEWEETMLAQIPIVYLSDNEESVLTQGDKETTAHIYRVIKTAEEAVKDLHEKARSWQDQYASLAQLIQDLNHEYENAAHLYSRLQETTIHPVQWEKTLAVMKRVQQQIEGIGPVIKKRSLAQLRSDLASASVLQGKVSELLKHLQEADDQHGRFISILGTLRVDQIDDWLSDAVRVADQAGQYDPANFSPEIQVQTLGQDLKQLSTSLTTILPQRPDQPLRESELPGLLTGIQELGKIQADLGQRSTLVQQKLGQLKLSEEELRDPLLRSKALLSQACALVGANPFLKRQVKTEPDQILNAVEKSIAEFDQRGTGTVEVKIKKGQALLKRVDQSLSNWATLLERDLEDKKTLLASKVEILESKLRLDEPSISESIKLLKQEQVSGGFTQVKTAGDSPAEMVVKLKTLNEAWQTCVINLQKIDEFAGSILDLYKKTEKYRTAALERFARAEVVAPEAPKWPATNQRLTNERNEIQVLEKDWTSLQNAPRTAIQIATKLSDLSEHYHTLDMQMSRLIESAQQEQGRLNEFEKRLGESRKMWLRQAEQYRNNRSVQDGVEKLLDEINRDHEALKRRYERGIIQYAQALQGMRLICRKIDDTMVPIDDRQEIDINGIVQHRV